MDLVFITDLHFKATSSTRTGDILDDLMQKLDWVVEYCNSTGSALLIGGDLFDRPGVSDLVKNRIIKSLMCISTGVYGISGNHDRLYDNPEFNYKTSWATLTSTGVIKDLDEGDVDLGDVVLSSTLPVKDKGKPCVFLYHGLLNIEDGRNTFRFSDIEPHEHDTLVLLGHDHKVYEPIQFDAHTTIIRPGSFQRCVRADESKRQPNLIKIHVDNSGIFSYKEVEIACARDWQTIFSTKAAGMTNSEVHASYADVIRQISEASSTQMTLEEALAQIGSPEVVSYMLKLLEEIKNRNSYKRQNL